MKKVWAVLLTIVMCFTLAGCGEGESKTSKDTSIALTTDNYDNYLELSLKYGVGGDGKKISGLATPQYPNIIPDITISGASSNFIFNDVKVTIRLYGTYNDTSMRWGDSEREIDETITINCNVGGNGTYNTPIQLLGYSNMVSINIAYEIVSVSGSVTPVNV